MSDNLFPQRIVVIGPGALGSLFAARIWLSLPDVELTLLDYRAERARQISQGGIRINSGERRELARPQVSVDTALLRQADLVFCCVKSFSFAEAIRQYLPFLNPDCLFVALQNGLGHLSLLKGLTLPRWALLVSTEGAYLDAPGRLCWCRGGASELGFLRADWQADGFARLLATNKLLNEAGLSCEVVPDIKARAWRKLVINAAINPVSVLFNCPNGELLQKAEALRLMEKSAEEAAEIANQAGVLIEEEPRELVAMVCARTAANISSMLQDIRQGRHTEIGAINGELIRYADEYGLAAETLRMLYHRVQEIGQVAGK